ncbi:hypothetical protein CXF68_12380 [Tenacibaculum sp. Bg11-29]|uniref:hypothetical protein n=1 Tax=Tenacibaculum sp. Bg11-29 TaxID=2058306 RepID=UPI000C329DB6|nr:hypothetical protein [Tenacibaculum sp. Bg11-29]PKH51429.1 hypothetical protein CXF68_12380 [Tenacibaculum sp. Bg11-29]
MSRVIKIEKVNNSTLVSITEKGNTQTSYSSIRRNVTKHLNGVQIQPDPEEAAFNNFYIDLDELEDSFGAKTPEALITEFAVRGFFSGGESTIDKTIDLSGSSLKFGTIKTVPPMSDISDIYRALGNPKASNIFYLCELKGSILFVHDTSKGAYNFAKRMQGTNRLSINSENADAIDNSLTDLRLDLSTARYRVYNLDYSNFVLGTDLLLNETYDFNFYLTISGASSSTDLAYTQASENGLVNSSTGESAIIPLANVDYAGLMPNDFIETGTFQPSLVNLVAVANETPDTFTYDAYGMYYRIGKVLHFEITILNINTQRNGARSGNFIIKGLPYFMWLDVAKQQPVFSDMHISGLDTDLKDLFYNFTVSNSHELVLQGYNSVNDRNQTVREGVSYRFTNGKIQVRGTYLISTINNDAVINRHI